MKRQIKSLSIIIFLAWVVTASAQIEHYWTSYAEGRNGWGKSTIIIHYVTTNWDSTKVRYNSSADSVVNHDLARYHHIAIDTRKLTPGSTYDYDIINGLNVTSGTFYVTHTPYNDSSYCFVAYGQSYANVGVHQTLITAALAEKPKFIVHLGNLTDYGDETAEYHTHWLDLIDHTKNIPIINVLNDWEDYRPGSDDTARLFIQPNVCKESVRAAFAVYDTVQDYTCWDMYPANFATFNTEKDYWLSDSTWQHGYTTTIPGYSWAKYGIFFSGDSPYISSDDQISSKAFRGRIDSLMDAHGFKVSISAGGMFYQRSHIGDKVYICSGLGGAGVEVPNNDSAYVDASFNTSPGYVLGRVTPDSLKLIFKTMGGTLIDSVKILPLPYALKPITTLAGDAGNSRVIQFATFNLTNGSVIYSLDPAFATYNTVTTSSTRDHVFRLTGLTPGNTYYYRCGYTGYVDTTAYSFVTPSANAAVKIVLFGDWGLGRYPNYNAGEWLGFYHIWDWKTRGISDANLYLNLGEGLYYGSCARTLINVLPYLNSKPIITNRTEQADTTIRMSPDRPYYSYARWGKVGIFTLYQTQYPSQSDSMLDWFEGVLDTVTAPILISNGHFQGFECDSADTAIHITISTWIDSLIWARYWADCEEHNVLGFYSHRAQIDGEAGRGGKTRWERLDRKVGRRYDISIPNSFNSYPEPHNQSVLILEVAADNSAKIIRHAFMPTGWVTPVYNDTLNLGKFASKKFKRYTVGGL